ncbi:TPA: mandelate racemase/muconate lactonizing enzyme family protein [Candidatus Poribacteria bacterium]|nr:mandelate racemase/muconate lactonizing enzyme family protein [Candidatus Poribacteria bacterium]HIO81038.1 mandelate racemase/muconate lactonizing enzyme family protein [Candidatus Poribacteria bacterium]
MKITAVESFPIRIKSQSSDTSQSFYRPSSPNQTLYAHHHEAVFIRIEVNSGLVGWGEALAPVAPEVTAAIIDKLLGPILLGRDARNMRSLWSEMYNAMRVRGNTTGFMLDAIAACDIALWDLKGKIFQEPIWRLIGGSYRDQIPVYVSGLSAEDVGYPAGSNPIEVAQTYITQGFTAFKGIPLDLSFRQAVGAEVILLYDGMWRYSLQDAISVARRLQTLDIAFFECPLAPEAIDDHRTLRQQTGIAVALGEAERTRYQFRELLIREAVDIIQADVGRTGLSEYLAIVDLAQAFHRQIAPHASTGLGICIAASIHLCAAIPNLYLLEYKPKSVKLANQYLTSPLVCQNGTFQIPAGIGLGVEPDYSKIMDAVSDY